MVKIALLIGVSNYGTGLSSLPETQEDIRAMQRALLNPKVGGFDVAELLSNPDPTQMQMAIERLFSENRGRDDLILLYFSGHGFKDDKSTLYFATRLTEKNPQGRIRTSTAVPASALQNYMSQSRSKRQVLILDCCFSGAFANDMKAKQADEAVDVKTQLGSEGRAVLTSSTANQSSLGGEGTSIYTRYLVQGLESGAADRDGDGQIMIDELHEYARDKVQEAAPTMQPEIYAVREGYKILIARAPQGDPKLVYRKDLDTRAKQKRGRLSHTDQRALKFRWKELGLSTQEAEHIADEVLQPYQAYWAKLEEFEQAVKEILDSALKPNENSLDDLENLQRVLNLRDEDVEPIKKQLNKAQSITVAKVMKRLTTARPQTVAELFPPTPPENFITASPPYNQRKAANKASPTQQQSTKVIKPDLVPPHISPKPTSEWSRRRFLWIAGLGGATAVTVVVLNSLEQTGRLDYSTLEELFKVGNWAEADRETFNLMLQAANRSGQGWLDPVSMNTFPCAVLRKLDQLWMQYSNGKFGFSVQKRIWQEAGSSTKLNAQWEEFGDRVGWVENNQWITYSSVIFGTQALTGHLPFRALFGISGERILVGGLGGASLISRYADCTK